MASADVIREQPVKPPVREVILTLTPEEAATLLTLLHTGVGGIGSNRNRLDGIGSALRLAGVPTGYGSHGQYVDSFRLHPEF